MNIKQWKKHLTEATESIGTYKTEFDAVIDTLADILARRDSALEIFYKDQKGKVVVEHTNRAGATNYERNPTCRVIDDLNGQALTYWRELGLTPKGLRAITDETVKEKRAGLGDLINEIIIDG